VDVDVVLIADAVADVKRQDVVACPSAACRCYEASKRSYRVPSRKKQAPELVQFGALTAKHFARRPVWLGVHTVDYGEPWYDGTDEETFRPFVYVDAWPRDAGQATTCSRQIAFP
jgi:hypothetical protein